MRQHWLKILFCFSCTAKHPLYQRSSTNLVHSWGSGVKVSRRVALTDHDIKLRRFPQQSAGRYTWTHILTHQGLWEPTDAVAWCVWTAFATLAGLGIIRPLKMLPILLLEIFYNVLWLVIVAYPLWSKGQLVGSPAEGTSSAFLWVKCASYDTQVYRA